MIIMNHKYALFFYLKFCAEYKWISLLKVYLMLKFCLPSTRSQRNLIISTRGVIRACDSQFLLVSSLV